MDALMIWLCWTLVNGKAADVDSFLSQEQCQSFQVAQEGRRQAAIEQHPAARAYSFSDCKSVEVKGPPVIGERT